jgi:hypothetical protein
MVEKSGLPPRQPPIYFGNQRCEGREVEFDVGQRQTQIYLRETSLLTLEKANDALQAVGGHMHGDKGALGVVDLKPGCGGKIIKHNFEAPNIGYFSSTREFNQKLYYQTCVHENKSLFDSRLKLAAP